MAEPTYSTVASKIAIGIDIGTCHCSVAFWGGSQVELIINTQNQDLMHSYFAYKDESLEGGVDKHLANEYEVLSGAAAIFNLKRLVGRVYPDHLCKASNVANLVNNMWRSNTSEDVLAVFLTELRLMAEFRFKCPVRAAVLTIPVSFTRFQVKQIQQACAVAGLKVLGFMPEPTAAALLYAQQQHHMGTSSEKIVVIFNMGAGFCDAAISATAGGVSQIKALTGAALGGEDILLNTMLHLFPDVDTHFSTHGIEEITRMRLLQVATQDAIHKLSSQSSVQVDVDLGNGSKICKVLDVEEFEEVNREIFDKCESLIKQCLHNANVEIDEISDVVLVGGCSNIPKLRKIVTGVCKKDLYSGINPLEAAVRGVALESAVASAGVYNSPFGKLDLLSKQVTPLSIGVRADGNNFMPIIHENTTMPVRRDMIFTTVHDNQAEALIVVYEGDDHKVVVNNHLLGYFKITWIPPAPKGVPEINVCMDLKAFNVLRVFVRVIMPGEPNPAGPVMEVSLPTVDDNHGWGVEALNRIYGTTLDLVSVQKKATS